MENPILMEVVIETAEVFDYCFRYLKLIGLHSYVVEDPSKMEAIVVRKEDSGGPPAGQS